MNEIEEIIKLVEELKKFFSNTLIPCGINKKGSSTSKVFEKFDQVITLLKEMPDRRALDRKICFERLLKDYEAAEKNLKNNPKKCGGAEGLKGFMEGIVRGMVQLDDRLVSRVDNNFSNDSKNA